MDQRSHKELEEQRELSCVDTPMVIHGDSCDKKSDDTSRYMKQTTVVERNEDTTPGVKVRRDFKRTQLPPQNVVEDDSFQGSIQQTFDVKHQTVIGMSGGYAKNSNVIGQICGDVKLKGLELYEHSISVPSKDSDRKPRNVPLASVIPNDNITRPKGQIYDTVEVASEPAGRFTQEPVEQKCTQVTEQAIARPVEQQHDGFRQMNDTSETKKVPSSDHEGQRAVIITKQETYTQQTVTALGGGNVEGSTVIGNVSGNLTVKVSRSSEEFKNMIKNTRTALASGNQRKHVNTFGERSALKLLKHFGCVFIKGRSGTGKSRLGRSLLSKIEGRTPIMICRPQQWDSIPMSKQNRYVALIDDFVGSSKLDQAKVDEWESMFEMMWPSVESGHIAIVLTSRQDISAQCKDRFKAYPIMKQMKCVHLDEEKYSLKPREKRMFIKKYIGRKHNLLESEIKQIIKIDSSLGFPQCCAFYSSSKNAQSQGLKFFQKPFECLRDLISTIKKCDPLEYVVLMLVMMYSGHLDLKFLHPQQPAHPDADLSFSKFKCLVEELSRTCDVASPPACGQIKVKADSLLGVFLCHIGNEYQFQHQSIFDALFLDLVKQYPEMCLRICPADMLVELVHTTEGHVEHEGVVLADDNYDVLAERVTELLLSGCTHILCKHSFVEDKFLQHIIDVWQQHILIQKTMVENKSKVNIIFYQIPSGESTFVKHGDRHSILVLIERDMCLFECDNLLGNIILTNHSIALSLVKMIENNHRVCVSNQALTCAIYSSQSVLIKLLMQKGLAIDENCFRALCASAIFDEDLIHSILDQLELEWDKLRDIKDMLFLSSLNGNVAVVELLVSKLSPSDVFDCLKSIYHMMGYSRRFVCGKLETEKLIKLEMVIRTLMKCLPGQEWTERIINKRLIQLCSSHNHAVGFRAVIDRCPTLSQIQWSSMLQHTLCFGDLDVVHELLKLNTDCRPASMIGKCLCKAIQARLQSEQKTGLMMKYFKGNAFTVREKNNEGYVNYQNNAGNTPLHYASMHGRTAIMKLLIEEGADINAVSESTNETALNFAVRYNQLEAVNLLLCHEANVNFKPALLDAKVYEIVKCLVSAGADVSVVDKRGRTALFKAAENDELEAAKVLCSKGCDINKSDDKGTTVLHLACWYGDLDFVQYLFEKGARVTADHAGMSVLHYAARSRNEAFDKIEYLFEVTSVDVNVTDNEGKTPLFPAVTLPGDMEIVEFLKDKGADVNKRDKDGETVLHKACLWTTTNPLKVVRYLLDIGVDPNLHGRRDRKALHMILKRCVKMKSNQASRPFSDLKQICCLLISNTADINQSDSGGVTPLHLALDIQDTKITKLLIDKGADRRFIIHENFELQSRIYPLM